MVIFATDTKNNIHQFLNNFSYVNLKIDWAQRKSKLFKSQISLIWGTIVTLFILVYFRIKLNFDRKNVSLQTRLFPMNREIMSSQIKIWFTVRELWTFRLTLVTSIFSVTVYFFSVDFLLIDRIWLTVRVFCNKKSQKYKDKIF